MPDSNSSSFKLDSSWFNRYAKINYSVDEWYIAISRRARACRIFDNYFRIKGSETPFPLLGYAGNSKYHKCELIRTLGKQPSDREYMAHILLQPYYQQGLITVDIANKLRYKYSRSDEDIRNLVRIITRAISKRENIDNNNTESAEKILELHEINNVNFDIISSDLTLKIFNPEPYIEELKLRCSDNYTLIDIEEKIKSGKILTILSSDDFYPDITDIINIKMPLSQREEKSFINLTFPVSDFSIFNMFSRYTGDSDKLIQEVSKYLSEGSECLVKRLREEFITDDSLNDNASPTSLLIEDLKTFGWNKTIDSNGALSLSRAVCSIDLTIPEEEILYNFRLWLNQYTQPTHTDTENNTLRSKDDSDLKNKKLTEERIERKTTTRSKNIERLEMEIKKLNKKHTDIVNTILNFEKRYLLCFLDFTILSLLNENLSYNDINNNHIHNQVIDKDQKKMYFNLVRKAMDKTFIKELQLEINSDKHAQYRDLNIERH
ncbi:hypothetical protein [Lelliottia wanjuensis]|uniref:hypothetical protein n=1 Tax=Lelliottia wanjuensis TaxID=3050585 RepID=UPI00254A3BE3|nr:hypothetical protein [Lelliottia sp. V86_10]MDK9584655.1 hypothetical protein [Lelliottia sp. V86_10]